MSDRQKAIQAIEDGVADPEDFGAALLGVSEEAPPMPDSTRLHSHGDQPCNPSEEAAIRAELPYQFSTSDAQTDPEVRAFLRDYTTTQAPDAITVQTTMGDLRRIAVLATTPPLDVETLADESEVVLALERTLANFKTLLANKPVRDAAETIAEAESALARLSKSSPKPR